MRKIYLLFACLSIFLLATSSMSLKQSSNGIIGYTGAPGSFGTCFNCHGGGSSAVSGITITAVPSFTNNQYMPDSSYQVTVAGAAQGFGRYGFACEILTPANLNAGVISGNAAGGVQVANFKASRTQVVHVSPKVAATGAFTFPWKAPSTGTATIFAIVNAVNGDGNTAGDFPITPVSLALSPMPEPVDTTTPQDTTSILEQLLIAKNVQLYPNPAATFAGLSFYMNTNATVWTCLTDINGREIKRTKPVFVSIGPTSLTVDLLDVPEGAYFISLQSSKGRLAQKLLLVR